MIGVERIRAARLARGWTLRELAEASGVEYTRISRIERGQSAEEEKVKALCDALGLTFHPATIE